jgi:hypothetical protein
VLEALIMADRKDDRKVSRMIGRFVIADPAICHGQRDPTFWYS